MQEVTLTVQKCTLYEHNGTLLILKENMLFDPFHASY
jgi:hypothetical protein